MHVWAISTLADNVCFPIQDLSTLASEEADNAEKTTGGTEIELASNVEQ